VVRDDVGGAALERDGISVVECCAGGLDQSPPARKVDDDLGIMLDVADSDRALGEMHQVSGARLQRLLEVE
jgi:hypothetical protein